MMLRKLLLITLFLSLTAAKCKYPVDQAMSATEGRDATIGMVGCADKRADHLFCRVTENVNPKLTPIKLVLPLVDCDHDTCIKYQIFRLDGSPGLGGSIPKGQNEINLTLAEIVGHDEKIAMPDNGEYTIGVAMWFKNDGTEYQIRTRGFVRVLVLKEGYERLVCNDPIVAWKMPILNHEFEFQYSTAFRSRLCEKSN